MLKKISFFVLMIGAYAFLIDQPFIANALAEAEDNTELIAGNNYVCPMHSHIVSHEEDKCPICGMDLVPNKSASAANKLVEAYEDDSSHEYPSVRIEPAIAHNLGLRTAVVEKVDMVHTIKTIGKVSRINPSAVSQITPGVAGELLWIAEKYTADLVKEGELLFVVASTEVFELEKDFQKALIAGDMSQAQALEAKLISRGLNDKQIALLKEGSSPDFPVKVIARKNGRIFSRQGNNGDAVMASSAIFSIGSSVQEIEVTVEVFERNWNRVKEGQRAKVQFRSLPGKTFYGAVVKLDKSFGLRERALYARIGLKVEAEGMVVQNALAQVIIEGRTKHHVTTVPVEAVIRTAQGDRVIKVIEKGKYQPVAVTIGEESGGKVEIISGIEPGAEVIISGQFLIDSESNLQGGLRQMSVPVEKDIETN